VWGRGGGGAGQPDYFSKDCVGFGYPAYLAPRLSSTPHVRTIRVESMQLPFTHSCVRACYTLVSAAMSNGVLCLAARSANVERVDALLDAGAIVDFTDKRGYTALMCACENTSTVESARMLVDAGANVNFVVVRVHSTVYLQVL
jgi:hypothetical protein